MLRRFSKEGDQYYVKKGFGSERAFAKRGRRSRSLVIELEFFNPISPKNGLTPQQLNNEQQCVQALSID